MRKASELSAIQLEREALLNSENQLSGAIPQEIGSMKNLKLHHSEFEEPTFIKSFENENATSRLLWVHSSRTCIHHGCDI
ncbi:hypothetical protein Q3G72_005416 [Acer saccharum]|nr:hypothetical protein Q3G72_005416 [Acer saccharum]